MIKVACVSCECSKQKNKLDLLSLLSFSYFFSLFQVSATLVCCGFESLDKDYVWIEI